MANETIEIGVTPLNIEQPIAPGSPFVLDIKNDDEADWTGFSLACDVRDTDNALAFRVTSADGEIAVHSTDKTRLIMTWPIAKTANLADYTRYKFDIIVTGTKQIVWPITWVTTCERVTE